MPSGPQSLAAAAAPSQGGPPSSWIHRSWNEQAFERHSKGRCRQPFAPTKAMNRVRAIATNRTQSSLTGGCFEPRIVRICTEFCGSESEPDQPSATEPGSFRFWWLFRSQDPAKPRHGAVEQRMSVRPSDPGRKTKHPHPFLRDPSTLQMRKRQNRIVRLSLRSTWRARNSQRSINASHCSFESLAHNSQLGDAALLIRTSAEFEQPHRVTPG